MSAKINVLINKKDNSELIRDEITAIIVTEQAAQKVLAASAPMSEPDALKFNVYYEKSTPWEMLIDSDEGISESSMPVVNVWFDGASLMPESSNSTDVQKYRGTFNIDCYAAKTTEENTSTGEIKRSDVLSSLACQRLMRIIRNIIMNHNYKYLNYRKTVMQRVFTDIKMFTPGQGDQTAVNVCAGRLTLSVEYLESTSENTSELLELIQAKCTRSSDGLVYFDAGFDETIPD